jgi:DNA polymerase I
LSRTLLPTRCERCPLKDSPTVQGFGPGDSYVVVGEAPGNTEVSRHQPFIGQAGRLLRVVLSKTGIDPNEVYYTNSVLCHPPGNKTPGIAQIRCCRPRLEEELALIAPTKILSVGGTALTAVLRADKAVPITRWHGRGVWTEWGGRMVYTLPTFHPAAVLRDAEYFRDFADDIVKWSEHTSPMPNMEVDFVVPATLGSVTRYLFEMVDRRDLTIDIETTGDNPLVNRIVTVGIGNDDAGVIVSPLLLKVQSVKVLLKKFLTETYGGEFALWNAKFDIQFLDVYFGEYIRPRAADCMVMHYTLDERPFSKYKSHGLKTQARIHYDAEDYDFDFTKGLGKERLAALCEYQALDLGYTSKLKRDLRAEMDEQSPHLASLFYSLLMPATYTLAEMELHGVKIDRLYLEQLRTTTQAKIDEKTAVLQALAAEHGMENFNPQSQPQLSTLIYKHWKAPKPRLAGKRAMEMPADTTAKDVLFGLAQRATDPVIKHGLTDIVELRLLKKIMATYIEKILNLLGRDGRLRSDFKLLGTATGRLSSAAPNIQNIPLLMGPQIRNAFIPAKGSVWVAADYSQLELRVAAVLADDEAMQDVFRTGRDIHTEVASMIFKKPADKVTKAERVMAKHVDFGIIYGRSAQSLVEGAELEYKDPDAEWWSIDEAELFLYRFLNGFPKLKLWIEETKKFALENQYVESPLGRRRRWPFIAPGTANAVGREAANFPIQGTASDICLSAMIKLHDELPRGAYVLFPIHDSINFEVREEILEPVLQQIYQTMTSTTLLKTDVPFDVEIEIGKRWGQTEKWKR